ncbi:PEP-CTERM sorting domain-containing protein [Crocosphaera sp. XPORK-15E]|uniref:PEP-CTERM sorting domain-containing protein n=1 Tax=Crocosphaera sp. XPORK-15E TaxID=3110247 RepID=UPI002B218A02|nr:PEP-CTERM sorting domain-containing protein [Crocosphaera sp. XPORK-15E]MEA5534036.1 PEP-CTERM sorting domain-containing protein [Crocosphaera sp. XPORK-15E]
MFSLAKLINFRRWVKPSLLIGGSIFSILINQSAQATTFTFNNSQYSLTNFDTWTGAQAQAQAIGGNLVTVNDLAEHQFLLNTFGTSESLWIGFTDQDEEGVFKWISGESVTFTNWVLAEPTDSGNGEDYTAMNQHLPGGWNDIDGQESFRGVIEVKSVPEPEPLTMLGAATAIGFGANFKRKLAKNSKKK